MKMDDSELHDLMDQVGQGHQSQNQYYNILGNTLDQEKPARIPPNFNKGHASRNSFSDSENKGTTSVTGNGHHRKGPDGHDSKSKNYRVGTDPANVDIIFRAYKESDHPSPAQHDQPIMIRLTEKRLSEVSSISDEQYLSSRNNNYPEEDEEKIPFKQDKEEIVPPPSTTPAKLQNSQSNSKIQYMPTPAKTGDINRQIGSGLKQSGTKPLGGGAVSPQSRQTNELKSVLRNSAQQNDCNVAMGNSGTKNQQQNSQSALHVQFIIQKDGVGNAKNINTQPINQVQNALGNSPVNSQAQHILSHSKTGKNSPNNLVGVQGANDIQEDKLQRRRSTQHNLPANLDSIQEEDRKSNSSHHIKQASNQLDQGNNNLNQEGLMKEKMEILTNHNATTPVPQRQEQPPQHDYMLNSSKQSQRPLLVPESSQHQTLIMRTSTLNKKKISSTQENLGGSSIQAEDQIKLQDLNLRFGESTIQKQSSQTRLLDDPAYKTNVRSHQSMRDGMPTPPHLIDSNHSGHTRSSVKSVLKSKTLVSQTGQSMRGIVNIGADGTLAMTKQKTTALMGNQMPGLIPEEEEETQPEVKPKTAEELEEEENERKAKEAFKILAGILKKAKEEKYQQMKAMENQAATDINELNARPKIATYNMKKWRIYPEGKFSTLWDLLMTILVIISCIIAPYMLAFQQEDQQGTGSLFVLDTTVNIIFMVDLILRFFTAYIDEEDLEIRDEFYDIAMDYIKSWFLIDLVSIIPFDLIFSYTSINRIARFTRIGKLAKIVRMIKMVRLLKIAKVRSKLMKNFQQVVEIAAGFERLVFLMLIFLILIHVIACFWVFIARFDETSKENWIYSKGIVDIDNYNLYITSFYFSVTTIVTVGYGDITAISATEKIVCVFLMITGVIAFSFATGALASIIANVDASEAMLKEKMATLQDIQLEYSLLPEMYNKLVKALRYDHSKKSKDLTQFMDELPHKLKLELAMVINKKMYSTIEFFKNKTDQVFIAWIGTVLRSQSVQEEEYIFQEKESIIEMYFLVKGRAAFVLRTYENKEYAEVHQGEQFGHVDLFGRRKPTDELISVKKNRSDLIRLFTCRAQVNCEVLTMLVQDLDKMRIEFPDIYIELYNSGHEKIIDHLRARRRKRRECVRQKTYGDGGAALLLMANKASDTDDNLLDLPKVLPLPTGNDNKDPLNKTLNQSARRMTRGTDQLSPDQKLQNKNERHHRSRERKPIIPMNPVMAMMNQDNISGMLGYHKKGTSNQGPKPQDILFKNLFKPRNAAPPRKSKVYSDEGDERSYHSESEESNDRKNRKMTQMRQGKRNNRRATRRRGGEAAQQQRSHEEFSENQGNNDKGYERYSYEEEQRKAKEAFNPQGTAAVGGANGNTNNSKRHLDEQQRNLEIEVKGPSTKEAGDHEGAESPNNQEGKEVPQATDAEVPEAQAISVIKNNLQRLKELDKEKKQKLIEMLFFKNTKDIKDKSKLGGGLARSSSESGSQSDRESALNVKYAIDDETYESIARIEDDVADLKEMFMFMISASQRMTERIERKLNKVAAKQNRIMTRR